MLRTNDMIMDWIGGRLTAGAELALLSRLLREERPIQFTEMADRVHTLIDIGVLSPAGEILRRPAITDIHCTQCGAKNTTISGGTLECDCGHSTYVAAVYTT